MKINDKETEATWNCFLEDGGVNTFLQVPRPKPRYSFNWNDASGEDVDDGEELCFESMLFTVPVIFYGSMPTVNENIDAFVNEVKRPFSLTVDEIGKTFSRCYFDGSSNAEQVGDDVFAVRVEFSFKYNW